MSLYPHIARTWQRRQRGQAYPLMAQRTKQSGGRRRRWRKRRKRRAGPVEKKRVRTGAERGGGSATGGGSTAIRWPSFSLDLDLDLDLDFDLDSLELAGSSRHGQGGKARSSLVRKDAQGRGVLAALHDRITAAATPEESRTIGGTEVEGARRDSRGLKARQTAGSRARGLGVPGLRGGGGGGSGGGGGGLGGS